MGFESPYVQGGEGKLEMEGMMGKITRTLVIFNPRGLIRRVSLVIDINWDDEKLPKAGIIRTHKGRNMQADDEHWEPAQVNWSVVGAVSPADSDLFITALGQASAFARAMDLVIEHDTDEATIREHFGG